MSRWVRRIAVARALAKSIEDGLQPARPCDDDAQINGAEFEQQAEVIEVAVEERILVVPFDFQRHPILVAVHLVGRRVILDLIHDNPGVELLFEPTKL